MLSFFSGKNQMPALNRHAGRHQRGNDLLQGGHGTADLEEERRSAHQQVAEKRQGLMQGLSAYSTVTAQGQLDEVLSGVDAIIARMKQVGRAAASTIRHGLLPQVKTFTASLRDLCYRKNFFRPVASAEPAVNTAALFGVFFVAETFANTSIFYGLGRFQSVHGAVIFSATIAGINLALAWVGGYLCLRNLNHSSKKVGALSRRSLLPLAVGWLLLHGGAAFMRLSENLDFRALQFSDIELMDFFSTAMLVLIAVLTTTICTWKAYKKCGDSDGEMQEMDELCRAKPQNALKDEADASHEDLDKWREKAHASLKSVGAKLEQDEAALNKAKALVTQGNHDLKALAERLQKSFDVSMAEVSTRDKFYWGQTGTAQAGLEFSAQETSITWDNAGEAHMRAFLQRARERLNQSRTELEGAYKEASEQIHSVVGDVNRHLHFNPNPEVAS